MAQIPEGDLRGRIGGIYASFSQEHRDRVEGLVNSGMIWTDAVETVYVDYVSESRQRIGS